MPSRLTDHQLEAAIAASAATKARNEAKGALVNAGAAHARMVKNQAELDRRRRDREKEPKEAEAPAATPAAGAPRPPSRPVAYLAPRTVPDDAVRSAEELIRKWGAAGAVNALAQALATCTLDVADGTRVLQMRRAVQ
jgi:hypothetical protein